MPKTIKTSDLDHLKDQLASLPPKPKDALNQKEAVYALAESFKAMLAQGYSIEDAHDKFTEIENADLNIATFRTYLNEATSAKNKRKQTSKAPQKTRVKTPAASQTPLDFTIAGTPPTTVQVHQVDKASEDSAAAIASRPDVVKRSSTPLADGSAPSVTARAQDVFAAIDDPFATGEYRQPDAETVNAQSKQDTRNGSAAPQPLQFAQNVRRIKVTSTATPKVGAT
jgi:hypothetical protein